MLQFPLSQGFAGVSNYDLHSAFRPIPPFGQKWANSFSLVWENTPRRDYPVAEISASNPVRGVFADAFRRRLARWKDNVTVQSTLNAAAALEPGGALENPAVTSAVPVIRAENLRKVFRSGNAGLTVLAGANLSVNEGEVVAIVGPSGSGKSTLLHLLAALDTPTSGAIYFGGHSLQGLGDAQISEFRNRRVAFVWQRHHLLPDFSAAENVAMPLLLRGTPAAQAMHIARQWLDETGLAARAHHRASELSGGEQQRVAFARALVASPKLLLADEPTGDLDEGNAEAIFELMQRLHRSHRLTSILATHNLALARRCHRVLQLEHGILEPSGPAGAPGAQSTGEIG